MKKHLPKILSALLLCVFLLLLNLKVSAQKPTIASINPTSGKVGTLVTITGTNFSTNPAKNIVFFGAAMAQVDHVISDKQLVVVAPIGTDNELISVTNLTTGLTVNTSFAFHLTYTNLGQISFDVANQKEIVSAGNNLDVKTVVPKDLDGDGDIDLVVAIRDADEIRIYTNTSSIGQVSFAMPLILSTPHPVNIVVADLTGDGLMDLACGNFVNGDMYTFKNTSGALNAPISFQSSWGFSNSDHTSGLAAADIDGDGKLDLVKMNWYTSGNDINTVSVYRNKSINGSLDLDFAKDFDVGLSVPGYFHMAVGDFLGNLDGKPDLLVNEDASQAYILLKNTSTPGQISFTRTSALTTTYNEAIELADLNNDKLPDLIFGDGSGNVLVKLNLGNDTFAAANTYTSIALPIFNLSVSDFNGDSYPDILVGLETTGNVKKFEVIKNGNNAPGVFFPPLLFDNPLGSYSNISADIDGDGKQDVLLYYSGSSMLTVALNNQLAPADAETLPASNVTATTVQFSGNVKANTTNVQAKFEYGTDPDLATFTTVNGSTDASNPAYNFVLVNEQKTATYQLTGNFSADLYYRVIADGGSSVGITRGEIVKVSIPATVVGITSLSPNPNNGITDNGTVIYKVELSKPVTGVDAANFAIAQTGGITGATISNVLQNPIDSKLWQVTVNLGAITDDGTVQLSLVNATNLSSSITTTLPFTGEIVTVTPDILANTLPATNITANGATLNGAVKTNLIDVKVSYELSALANFSSKFAVPATVNATVTAGSGLTQTSFAFSNITTPGTYYYRVVATDLNGKDTYGQILSVQIPYTVKSIKAASPNPNDGKTGLLLYEVEFDGVIDNLSAANFGLATTGAVSPSISTVVKSGDPLKPNSWFVTLTLAQGGDGTVQLSLVNTNNLAASISNALPFAGEIYTIEQAIVATTLPASKIVAGGATLNGSVKTTLDGVIADFLYSTKPDLSNPKNVSAIVTNIPKNAGAVGFSADLINQFPGTYYYAALATDNATATVLGSILSVDIPTSITSMPLLVASPMASPGKAQYRVEFAVPLTGLTAANFNVQTTGGVGAVTISSVVVDVNDPYSWIVSIDVPAGTDGSLTLNLINDTGLPYKLAGLPYAGPALAIDGIPVAPQGLSANAGDALIKLDWKAVIDNNLSGYKIYAGTAPKLMKVIANVAASTLTYTDINLTNGTVYYYRITAVDGAGKESVSSNEVNATPKAGQVLKTAQTITFAALADKMYGDAGFDLPQKSDQGLDITYSSGSPSILITNNNHVEILHAGTATIFADQAGDAVYNAAGQVSQELNILARPISVKASAATKVAGTADPILTYFVAQGQFYNGDVNVINGVPVRDAGEMAGVYKIRQGTVVSTTDYNLTFLENFFTITAAPAQTVSIPQGLMATAGDALVKLDWNANTEANFKEYRLYSANMGNAPGLLTVIPAGATTYLNSGLANGIKYDYAISAVDAAGNESALSAIVSATPQAAQAAIAQSITFAALTDRTYGDADFDPGATASSGLLVTYTSSDNNIATIVNGKVHILHAGTVTIYANQGGNGTYAAAMQSSQTLTINPLTINITSGAKSKAYGAADPTLTYTYTPALIGADAFTGSLNRVAGELPGSYVITQGTVALSNDYTIKFNVANMVINPIPLTLTADVKAKIYGTTDPIFTYVMTSGSLLPGDALSGTLNRATGENVGSYVINQGSLTAGPKYTITLMGANMVISPAPLTIVANAATKEVGDADPVLAYTITEGKLIGTDVLSGTLDRAVGESVGMYAIGQGNLTAGGNYALSFIPANLSVVLKSAASFKLDANNILTPNGDGKNDKLIIKGLEQYPTAKLTIVDREGRVVYVSEHYQNDFDGTYKGSPLATDTYYYVIDFGNGLGKIKDFVTIVN